MDPIKNIINKVIGDISQNKFDDHSKLDRIWENILEKKELEHSKLIGIKKGVVSVYVDSPAWLYQLRIKKRRILERVKSEIHEVKNISFRIGKTK